MMKKLSKILLVLLFALASFADKPLDVEIRYKEKTSHNFDSEAIDGSFERPQILIIREAKSLSYRPLFNIKNDFRDEAFVSTYDD